MVFWSCFIFLTCGKTVYRNYIKFPCVGTILTWVQMMLFDRAIRFFLFVMLLLSHPLDAQDIFNTNSFGCETTQQLSVVILLVVFSLQFSKQLCLFFSFNDVYNLWRIILSQKKTSKCMKKYSLRNVYFPVIL